MERPKPRPFGLLLTNGLKASACDSGERPRPRSATATSRKPSSRTRVSTTIRRSAAGSSAIASAAFSIRFSTTCCNCGRLPRTITSGWPCRNSTRVCRAMSSLRASVTVAATIWLRSRRSSSVPPFTISRRSCVMMPAARRSSSAMSARISESSFRSGGAASSSRDPASALARMEASGWLSSCARAPDNAPSCEVRDRCASSRRSTASSSAMRPASPLLHDQRGYRGALHQDDRGREQDLQPVSLPARGLVEKPLGARRQQARVDPEPANLPASTTGRGTVSTRTGPPCAPVAA